MANKKWKRAEQRCPAMHNPGTWPYVSRCVKPARHKLPDYHTDKDGKTWEQVVTEEDYE